MSPPTAKDLWGELLFIFCSNICFIIESAPLAVLNSALGGAALLATALRVSIRYSQRKMWWDDYWTILAAVFCIGVMVADYLLPSKIST